MRNGPAVEGEGTDASTGASGGFLMSGTGTDGLNPVVTTCADVDGGCGGAAAEGSVLAIEMLKSWIWADDDDDGVDL